MFVSVALALLFITPAAPSEGPPPTYAEVAPIFARHCAACHGESEQNGTLRLDSYASVLFGGESGPSVIPGDSQQSPLVRKIERRERPAMPPRKRLPRTVITTIRAWIDAGALP